MINRKVGLTLTLLGFLLAVIGVFLKNDSSEFTLIEFIQYCGIIFLFLGALITYVSSKSFNLFFTDEDWEEDNESYSIFIPFKKHKKKSPGSIVYKQSDNRYTVVGVDIENIDDNNREGVLISCNNKFVGKITIK